MRVINTRAPRGPRGKAHIALRGKKAVITFEDTSHGIVELPRGDLPKWVKGGTWHVTLNARKDIVFGVRPLDGTFFVEVQKMAAPEGQPPVPKRVQYVGRRKDGTTFDVDYLGFTLICKVVQGAMTGCEIPVHLRYNFIEESGEESVVAIKGSGKHSVALADFLTAAGVIDTEIPFSENVLPTLESILQTKGQPLMLVIKNGWADSYAPLPDLDTTKKTKTKS